MKNEKIHNIDLLRIYFTIIIVFSHIKGLYVTPALERINQNIDVLNIFRAHTGYVTDCFFIISGYFMFNTFAEKKTLREILYSKFVRLWPALFVSVVFCFVLYLLKISTFHITANILMLLFIGRGLFEVPTTEIGVAWYTSSLFCSFVILYLIYKMFTDKSKYIFAFVSVLFYSSLFIKGNPYSEPLVFNNLINFFLMRGLAGLSTGYVLYYFLNTQKYIIKNKITATIFEILLSIFFVCITLFKDIQYSYPIIIISFLFLFSLMVKKDGYFFKILNKPFFSFLAKYSYTIFIIQENIFRYFINKLWYADCYIGRGGVNFLEWVLLPMSVCIIAGVFIYHILERPLQKLLRKLLP